jgi:hypothetical protein
MVGAFDGLGPAPEALFSNPGNQESDMQKDQNSKCKMGGETQV